MRANRYRHCKRQKTSSSASSTSAPTSEDDAADHVPPPLPWPKENPPECQAKPFPRGLLQNLDDVVWDTLAHVDPQLFVGTKEKGNAIREGLNRIGLGWVAMNAYAYRTAQGRKYDRAQAFYEQNGWRRPGEPLPRLTRINTEDNEWKPCIGGGLVVDGNSYTNENGDLEFTIVRDDDKPSLFPTIVADRINKSIQQSGMVVILKSMDTSNVRRIRSKIETVGSVSRLLYTGGSGKPGDETLAHPTKAGKSISSYYGDINGLEYLDQMQDVIVRSIKAASKIYGADECDFDGTSADSVANKRKCILLKYSKGGENWAHRDGNSDGFFEYQALLMLSNADEYDGGEFYVAKQYHEADGKVKIIRTYTRLNAGDLVLFQSSSDGEYDHGMKMVREGERVAVGLLQNR